MGALAGRCRARPALPGGGEPARTGERRRGARELHPRGRRADRDEHVRREPAQARGNGLLDERVRGGSTRPAVRLAREAREVSGRDVLIAGAIGPLGELEVFDADDHGPLYAEQAHDPRGPRRRPLHDRDVLRPRRARRRGGGGAGRLVAPDRGAAHLRRGSRDVGGRRRRARQPRGSPSSTWRDRHESRRRPARRPDGARRDAERPGLPLAAMPNIGLASIVGGRVVYPHSTPEYFAEFAAQAVRSRRTHHRRLLRHDTGPDRGDPGGTRRASARPRVAFEARERRAPPGARRRRAGDASSPAHCARASGSSASSSTRPRAGRARR